MQQVQKSPEAHILAKHLLTSPIPSVRYFGALTYTVYINQYRGLGWDHFRPLVTDMQLFIWEQLRTGTSNWNVIKKLLSGLSLLYIQFYKSGYETPVESLMAGGSDQIVTWDQFNSESKDVWQLLFTFLQILVEEIIRAEPDSKIHEYVQNHIYSVLNGLFGQQLQCHSIDLQLTNLECLNSWIPYFTFAESNSNVRYPDLNLILDYCLQESSSLDLDKLQVSVKAMANLTEILEGNRAVISEPYRNTLAHNLFEGFGIDFIKQIILSDDKQDYEEEITAFVSLVMAYLDLDILKLARDFLSPQNQVILNILLELVKIDLGYNDRVSDQLLKFWEDLANVFFGDDEVLRNYHEVNYSGFVRERNNLFAKLTTIYWSKSVIKPQLYEEYKTEIHDFRRQVADFFIVAYELLGMELYHILSNSVLNSLIGLNTLAENEQEEENIWKLEGSLWLLYMITDDLTFYETGVSKGLQDDIINLLNNGLIQTVYKLRFSSRNLNPIIFSTLLKFTSSISFVYLLPDASYHLQSILEMLFGFSLEKGLDLSLIASKTLLTICLSSRSILIPYLGNFETSTFQIIDDTTMDPLIVQRMVNAYISIALAVKDPSRFGMIILNLLQKIESAFKVPPENFTSEELYYEYHSLMPSLVFQMAKASNLPGEPHDFYTKDQIVVVDTYWQTDILQIKSFILHLVGQFSLVDQKLAYDASITEKCCQILKSGLNEVVDGPCKFPISYCADYLSTKIESCDQNSLPYLYELVQAIVDSNYKALTSSELELVLNKVFLEKSTQLMSDSDSIQTVVELFASILERKPSLVIHLYMMSIVLADFALPSITANETLTLRSGMKFWNAMITLRRGSQQDQQRAREMITEIGPSLTKNLMTGFIGTTRSNLEIFYPVFRNLIAKYQLQMKEWLQDVLIQLKKFDQTKIDTFIKRLLLTRGQHACNQILKEFWLETNGLVDYSSR